MHNYKEMIAWKKSMELVKEIYTLTQNFPHSEIYGLTSQMRRCAISIPSNIAEGSRRGGDKEFKRYVLISFGSGAELETQIQIAINVGLTTDADASASIALLDEVMRILNALQKKFSD